MLDLEMSCVQLHSGLNMLYTIQEAMTVSPLCLSYKK